MYSRNDKKTFLVLLLNIQLNLATGHLRRLWWWPMFSGGRFTAKNENDDDDPNINKRNKLT